MVTSPPIHLEQAPDPAVLDSLLADFICGDDDQRFPTYRSSSNLTRFFQALGIDAVHDGSTRKWWVLEVVSAGGSLYARLLLGVGVRDLTAGFKCYRRAVLERIDLDAIRSRGYAFQIETTYRALRAGFRVVEVPVRFVDREHGGS